MRIEFTPRHTDITPALERHAQPRLERLSRFHDRLSNVEVVVGKQRGRFQVEITLNADGQLIRAEESGNEEITAFDAAVEKVERQLVRFRSRLKERGRHTGKRETEPEGLEAEEPESEELAPAEEALAEELPAIEIVKTKAHPLKPMSPEEAVLQMEMVGHDFFMFTNGRTQQVNVVYRRQGGGYGLIEPELE